MDIIETSIAGVLILKPKIFGDTRGTFSETYNQAALERAGLANNFIQDNRSRSAQPFTVRGLHYQRPPYAQTKLLSVQHGRVYDVAVDLRRHSPTFGKHVAVELSAERGEQLFIPAGLAHGFCTLEPDTVVTYKVDAYYAPAHEGGLHWRTAALGIAWPCSAEEATLSAKDLLLPEDLSSADCFE